MLPVRKLSPAQFFATTVGGSPCRIDLSRYAGRPFDCACGALHPFQLEAVPVLRQLSGARLVVACPTGLPFVTCVRVRGFLRYRRFDSLFGAELVGTTYGGPRHILGVSANAAPEEIRTAYLDLVKVWHPDRFQGDPRLRRKAERQLQEINLAYEALQTLRTRSFASLEPDRASPPTRATRPVSSGGDLSKFRRSVSAQQS
jgi:hypothetical protein